MSVAQHAWRKPRRSYHTGRQPTRYGPLLPMSMGQHMSPMDNGQGSHWDRGGGDLAPHSPATPDAQGGVIPGAPGAPGGNGYMRFGSVTNLTASKGPPSRTRMPQKNTSAYALCNVAFQPDLTMYLDPSHRLFLLFPLSRFMAFNGGIRGDYIERRRPMFRLKEDDFVDNGGHLWNAKCLDFEGCGRNIAKHASADLMGRPCCAICFHTSLQRSEGTHL
jgi:hypothetical protein